MQVQVFVPGPMDAHTAFGSHPPALTAQLSIALHV
jgi:hypothetical protein